MAQITEIKIVCDECLRVSDAQTEGTEYQVGRYKFALCDQHYAEVLQPFEALMNHLDGGKSRRGAKSAAKAPSKPAEDASCEECGEVFSGEKYKRPKQALNMHKRNHHEAA